MKNRIRRVQVRCLGASIMWLVINAAFGIAPLVLLSAVNPILKGQPVSHEIKALIDSGIILFACCALMGAIFVDTVIERSKLSNLAFFAIASIPFAILSVISLLYILIILGHVSVLVFSTESKLHLCVMGFTMFYCILAKYYSLIKRKEV